MTSRRPSRGDAEIIDLAAERARRLAPMMTSDRQDWRTPACVLEAIAWLGPIALDPCGAPGSLVQAEIELRQDDGDDGLGPTPWRTIVDGCSSRLVYVNPPYHRDELPRWIARCVHEARQDSTLSIVLLVPARTETRWFQLARDQAHACAFWRGRLRFVGARAGAPFPSCLFFFNLEVDQLVKLHFFQLDNRALVWL